MTVSQGTLIVQLQLEETHCVHVHVLVIVCQQVRHVVYVGNFRTRGDVHPSIATRISQPSLRIKSPFKFFFVLNLPIIKTCRPCLRKLPCA